MKKSIFYFLLATLTVATFASCAKEEAEDVTPVEPKSSVIKFKADPINVGTKATLTPNAEDTEFAAAWEDGEEMVLNAFSTDAPFDEDAVSTWDDSEKEFSADFGAVELPTGSYEWLYEAWYPAKENIPFGTNRVQSGNNYNSAYDIMYGSLEVPSGKIGKDGSDNPIVVGMNRLTGIAYFHITGGPDEDVLGATLTTNEDLAAETVTIAAGGASLTPTTGKKTIALSFSSAPNAQDFKLWFNVLPGDYTGLTLTIYTATKKATISAASISFEAGKLRKVKKNITSWSNQMYFTKITTVGQLDGSNYLIVTENRNLAFNGSLSDPDVTSNTISVPIVGTYIPWNETEDASSVSITAVDDKYKIKTAYGLYIGKEADKNGLDKNATYSDNLSNTISFSDGYAVIEGKGGRVIRYNATAGQTRFRYFSSDYGDAVSLFKLNDTRTTQTLSFPNASYDATYPGTFDAPALSGANTTVTYSSSKTSVATVNASTGAITLAGIGSTVITASAAADATYQAASTSYTLVVTTAPITSIALLKSNLTNSSQNFSITLTDAIVTAKQTANHAFIEDGTAGIYVYNCASELNVGDKFTGTIAVSAKMYSGYPEITSFNASSASKTTNAALPLTTLSVAEVLSGISTYCGMRVKLEGVQFGAAISGTQNANASRSSSSIKVYSLDDEMNIKKDDIADIIGYPMSYSTPRFNVLTASDVDIKDISWTLQSIAVTTPPTKTSYLAGESFNTAGMVVTATYTAAGEYTKYADVTSSCTYSPTTSSALTTENTSITISFGGKSTSQAITVGSGGYSWSRVTTVSQLTAGGTFIIGYEGTANSGVIVPMRASGTMTTSATGYLYSGASSGTTSSNNTLTMSASMSSSSTSAYEVTIAASEEVDGAIVIKIGSNYIGNENTKNCVKLYTSEHDYTAFTPTIGTNNVVSLEITANTGNSDNYKYFKFNNSLGSYRFAVYKTTPDKIVIYKKGAAVK